jgi:Leucine-rich repeat (LRR) protein
MPLIMCNKITYLNLEGCPAISNEFITAFLPMKRSLTYLNLSTCRSVDDQALVVLSQQKLSLHALLLDSTKVSDKGLSLLNFLVDLEILSVGWNGKRVTSEGLLWLSKCHNLRQLCVCNTGVTKISKYANCKKLHILNLSKTKISLDKESYRTAVQFPNLEQIIMQRCDAEQIPTILLSPSLNVIDLSFSSVKSSILAGQLERFVAPDPINPLENEEEVLFDNPVEVDGAETAIEYDGFRSVDPQINPFSVSSTIISPTTPNRNNRCELDETCKSCSTPEAHRQSSMACNTWCHSESKFSSPASTPHKSFAIPSVYNLRILKLESCAIGDDVMKVVGKLTSLTELNISDTPVTNEGISHLASLKSMTSLNLNGCKFNNHALAALSNLAHLKELRLDCPNINDGALTHISTLKELETLDLFEAHITDSGLEFLIPLTSLKSFQACCGRLTNAALKTLSQIESLTSLNLSQNRYISDAGLRYLSRLQWLTHVNLSGCGITQLGLASLQSLSSIKTVSLFGCKIKPSSSKLKELPPGLQLGVDEGIVAID